MDSTGSPPAPRPAARRRLASWLPPITLAALIGVALAVVLIANRGMLAYTLDDAYIHLAQAENLRQGHYGVNLEEPSSPSSSILWPFLLALFPPQTFGVAGPLILNTLAAFATLWLYGRIGSLVLEDVTGPSRDRLAALLLVLAIPATNLVPLIFTGMEHSLQVFLTVLIIFGLIREGRRGRADGWLLAAIVLAPLVRYECLAISLPALLYLAVRRHVKAALLAGLLLASLLGGFVLFLHSLGLPPIPASVLAKTPLSWTGSTLPSLIRNLYESLGDSQGALLSLLLLPLLACLWSRRPAAEKLLAACVALAIPPQLAAGVVGSHRRYEAYIWIASLLALLYLFRSGLRPLAERVAFRKVAVFAGLATLLAARPLVLALLTIPVGAHNIYLQQYQMHRFVTEYYRAPVAVNDLGYVSYRNPSYVLDLWGLASTRALNARLTQRSREWMDDLCRDHGVKLAMIYDRWFGYETPKSWTVVGALYFDGLRVAAADQVVMFYAVEPGMVEPVKALLREFRETLPPGAHFIFPDDS